MNLRTIAKRLDPATRGETRVSSRPTRWPEGAKKRRNGSHNS